MFPLIGLLSTSVPTGGHSRLSCTMEVPEHRATVDQEAATVESTDEAQTVPQDDPTVARPHLLTLMYYHDTPAKLTDKFPATPLLKRHSGTFVMGRGQNLDVLLNDEHMPRRFVELWCSVDEEGVPKWFVKNLSEKKAVRLELGGSKTTAKLNEVKELRDGHKLKLEMLVFTVKIEDGDLVESAECGLEFRVVEDGSTSSSGSFRRQTSSSTDSSGSITSATDLARQAYGSSPVLGQNGFHAPVNSFGRVLPVGVPAHALAPVHPPGQFQSQGGLVFPLAGQAPTPGMAMPPGGSPVIYYPVTCAASLSGQGSHMSVANSHPPLQPCCGHLDRCQHYPNPQVCCQAGCNVHPQSHQQPPFPSHAFTGPGSYPGVGGSHASGVPGLHPGVGGSHASGVPGLHPGVGGSHASGVSGVGGSHASGVPGPYPGIGGSHTSAGPGPYPGIGGSHTSAGPGPYPGVGGSHTSAGPGPYPGVGGSHTSAGPGPYPGVGGSHTSAGPGPYPGVGGSHTSAGPGPYPGVGGSHTSAGPGPYPGVGGSHTSAGPGPHPGIGGSHTSAGPGPYPGVGSHAGSRPSSGGGGNQALASLSASPGPNSVFFSFSGGGSGPPAAGHGPPAPNFTPTPDGRPNSQQFFGQPTLPEASGIRHQTPMAVPRNGASHAEAALPGSGQPFLHSQHPDFSHRQIPSNDSMRVKERVSANCSVSQPGGHPPSADPCQSYQYPTLYTLEHQNPRFRGSGGFSSSRQHQSPLQHPDPLHGPLSMPPHQDVRASHYQSQRGPYGHGPDGAQVFVRAPAVITQPESAAGHLVPVQQPQSAMMQNLSGQQPESAMAHYLSGQQPESAMAHNLSGQQPESAIAHALSGQQPESAAWHHLSGQQSATRSQQATDPSVINATSMALVGMSPPVYYSPSGDLPAAPPVTQLSGLTLGTPVEATTPFPTEVVSATPANSLSHTRTEGLADAAYYLSTSTTTPAPSALRGAETPNNNDGIARTGGASYDQQGNRAMPFAGSASSAQLLEMSATVSSFSQMYSAPQLQPNVNLGELPLAGGAPAAFSSLTNAASNGNRINLRSHEGIAVSTPPSSDFSSEGSYRVHDLQGSGQDRLDPRRQPQEDDERQPQEHDDQD